MVARRTPTWASASKHFMLEIYIYKPLASVATLPGSADRASFGLAVDIGKLRQGVPKAPRTPRERLTFGGGWGGAVGSRGAGRLDLRPPRGAPASVSPRWRLQGEKAGERGLRARGKTTSPGSARAPPRARAVNQSNVGPRRPRPARRSLLPAPAPSPPAPGPARYNYSPLIRPGPGKRLPRGGQSLWLPTAPAAPSPRPQLSRWATGQARPPPAGPGLAGDLRAPAPRQAWQRGEEKSRTLMHARARTHNHCLPKNPGAPPLPQA